MIQHLEHGSKHAGLKPATVLQRVVLGALFRTMIGVEMQADPGFDLKLVAVGAALEDAATLPALCIARKEQQQLLVQEPGWKTEDATSTSLAEPRQQRGSTIHAFTSQQHKGQLWITVNFDKALKCKLNLGVIGLLVLENEKEND